MNDTWIFILVMVFGILPFSIGVYWFKYRGNILFKTSFAILITSLVISISSFIIGRYGIIHLIWYAPVGYLGLLLGNIIFKKRVQKPIKDSIELLKKVGEGNLEIEIDEDLKNSKDEIGLMSLALEDLIKTYKGTAKFAHELGEGNLDADIDLESDSDHLRKALIEMRNKLKEAADIKAVQDAEEEKRLWANEGLTKLNEILRQHNDVKELSYHVLSFLVNYLDANQGGVFVKNSDVKEKDVFELKSAYAYSRRKYMDKSFELGESLIGNCALEKETTHLTEIPNHYIEITSGLGNANPRSLLLIPMKIEEEVLGVIEIASFNDFKEYQVEFLEQASLSIASTLNMAETNKRTSELLERTQQQAEEMSAQEEEMRQNMEELQATQEESTRRNEEVERLLDQAQSQSEGMEAQVVEFQEREVLWQEKLEIAEDKIKELEELLKKKK